MSQNSYTKKPTFIADAQHSFKVTEAGCVLSNSATTCTKATGTFKSDGLTTGMVVTGPGIVAGTTITVNSETSLTLSQNTTSSAAGTVELLFAPASDKITYPSPMGWIQPGANGAAIIQTASTDNTTVTVNAIGHRLVDGQSCLITGLTGASIVDGYNGYVPAITYVSADQFTFPRTAVLGAASTNVIADGSLIIGQKYTIAVAGNTTWTSYGADASTVGTSFIATSVGGAGTGKAVKYYGNGQAKVWKHYEVLIAIGGLQAAYVDFATIPTFTAAVTLAGTGSGGTYHYKTGDVFTVVLTAAEAIKISGGIPTIALNITSGNKAVVYNELTSTGTSLHFDYTLVAGDIATATNVTVATSMVANGAKYFDISGTHEVAFTPGTFVAPVITTVAFN